MITAPYNFVPLNEKIFYPSWAGKVSHDIPFQDGESGEIDIKITAKSPIFIRNHHVEGNEFYEVKDDKGEKIKISKEFCHFKNNNKKEFYIPGSTIKGAVKNVLEIMSFSRINVDENKLKKILSIRDLTNNKLHGKASGKKRDKSFGYGILECKKNEYSLIDYGNKIRLILQNDIENYSCYKEKDVANKYKAIPPFKTGIFSEDNNKSKESKFFDKYVLKKDQKGEEGELFFGGHFNNKHYEFVLWKKDKKSINKTYQLKENDPVLEKFRKIYFEDKSEDNYIGNFWRGKNKIPVFYLKENNEIVNIGLTQIFKIPYKKTLFESAQQNIEENKLDLAETIFGTVRNNLVLKGRVQFSHFKATTVRYEEHNHKEVEQVLSSPKPTYYPNYIKQEDGEKIVNYTTLMDKDAIISGYKRYPLQGIDKNKNENEKGYKTRYYKLSTNDSNEINHDVTTKFKPLGEETIFEGKLKFHNLNKIEIGALLSAITFHNKNDEHFYNIGMGKPLGFGKIKIELQGFKYFDKLRKNNIQEYLNKYEEEMNNWHNKTYKKWISSEQLTELFAMSKNTEDTVLKYQLLENDNPIYYTLKNNKKIYEKNDFIGAKKQKEHLLKYSKQVDNENIDKTFTISKNKIKKEINSFYKENIGIFYIKNQLKQFFENKKLPNSILNNYNKVKENKSILSILKEIYLFQENKLSISEQQKLYGKLKRK